jgi:hypothetical protein
MAKTQAEVALEDRKLAYKRYDTDQDMRSSILKSLYQQDTDVSVTKAKLTEDFKGKALKALGDYQKAKDAGAKAAQTRAIVDIGKLIATAPVDFSKAAYTPDRALLDNISKTLSESATATDAGARQKQAWQTFYKLAPNVGGNLWGTYQKMLEQYGDTDPKTGALVEPLNAVDESDKAAWRGKQLVSQKLATEKAAAADAQERIKFLSDSAGAFDDFVARTGADPNDPATYDKFYADNGFDLSKKLPTLADPVFMRNLQTQIENPESYADELFRGDLKTQQDDIRKRIAKYEEQPGDDTPSVADDTERDKMAAWLARPEVQAWGKEHGFKLGTVRPLTDAEKADIAEGRTSGQGITKYGAYTESPDDYRALRRAMRDLDRRPEEGIFRAAGVGQKGSVVEVVVKVPPEKYLDAETGKFWKDPVTGRYLTMEQVNALPDDAQPVPTDEPPTKTILGVQRGSIYGRDAMGGVRIVPDGSNREFYIAPEDIAKKTYPGLRPDAVKTNLTDVVRGAAAKGVMKRQGLTQDPNETVPGPGGGKQEGLVEGGRDNTKVIKQKEIKVPIVPDLGLDEGLKRTSSAGSQFAADAKQAGAEPPKSPFERTAPEKPGYVAPAQTVADGVLTPEKEKAMPKQTFDVKPTPEKKDPKTDWVSAYDEPAAVAARMQGIDVKTEEPPAGTTTNATTAPTAQYEAWKKAKKPSASEPATP